MQNPLLNIHRYSFYSHESARLNSIDQKFTVHNLQHPQQHKLLHTKCSSKSSNFDLAKSLAQRRVSTTSQVLHEKQTYRAKDPDSSPLIWHQQFYLSISITRLNAISPLHTDLPPKTKKKKKIPLVLSFSSYLLDFVFSPLISPALDLLLQPKNPLKKTPRHSPP